MGNVDPSGGIEYGLGDHRRMSAHMSTIALQQPKMLWGVPGTDLSADSNHILVLANGNIYRTTMVLSQQRIVYVPDGTADAERVKFRFDHTAAGFALQIREQVSTNLVAAVTLAPATTASLTINWNGTIWYCLKWSGVTAVVQ